MKRAALRTLSLALLLTVVIGVCLRYRVVTAAAAGTAVTAGEFLVDPPTLINLGFEWFIEGDDNRNASVEVSYRKQGDTRVAARRCRCCGCRASGSSRASSSTSSRRTCSPAASSISSPTPAYEARFVLTRSRRRERAGHQDRDGADAARADAGDGRQRVPRLSARIQRDRRSSRRSKA